MSAEDWRDELDDALEPLAPDRKLVVEGIVEQLQERLEHAEGLREEAEGELRDYEQARVEPLDLLRELAEDRHKLGLDMAEEGWTGYGHTGTLRTCPNALCDAAATLLGR